MKKKQIIGIAFLFLFILTCIFGIKKYSGYTGAVVQIISIIELFIAILCLISKKEKNIENKTKKSFSKRNLISILFVLVFVPLTIFFGTVYLENRKYYFISLLIILETLLSFFVSFEKKKATSRELVLISVICAVSVVGRAVFYALPQFQPMTAVIIISGICFGGETGFLVGVLSCFVSNIFFGQGPWTPWQMTAFGLVGLMSGILFNRGLIKTNKLSVSIFGGLAILIIFGGIMNPASVILYQENINLKMIMYSYISGFPFDMIHVASTVFFLWFFGEEMIEKLERVKIKYKIFDL